MKLKNYHPISLEVAELANELFPELFTELQSKPLIEVCYDKEGNCVSLLLQPPNRDLPEGYIMGCTQYQLQDYLRHEFRIVVSPSLHYSNGSYEVLVMSLDDGKIYDSTEDWMGDEESWEQALDYGLYEALKHLKKIKST